MNKSLLYLCLFWASLTLSLRGQTATASLESPELAQARAHLLAAYERGSHDDDNDVKQTKAEITRLEYLATHAGARPDSAPRLITVSFPGGPMSALIAAADKSSADGFNVVAEKADLAIEVPAMSIRNAAPAGFANALDAMLRQRGYTLQQNYTIVPGQAPVFILRRLQTFEVRGEASPFQSFQLSAYLENQTVDDIIGAIRAAWELDPMHRTEALRLKFHPPTGILLVSAPPEGINLVKSVLEQLKAPKQPTSTWTPPPSSIPPSPQKK